MLILGAVMRFGFNSVVALNYGLYDVMVIIFILFLSIVMRGVRADPDDLMGQIFGSFYAGWFSPIVDMFNFKNGVLFDTLLLLYQAGKLLILALAVELLETEEV